jgi:hypothetical protein
MSNIENLMLLSGITIISGISIWMLNEEPKKSPKKNTPKKRSPSPERSPERSPQEIKTPLPIIRKSPVVEIKNSPKAEIPKAKSPKAVTPKAVTPKAKTPKAVTPKAKTPIPIQQPRVQFESTRVSTRRIRSPVRSPPRSRSILKRSRVRSPESISSVDATVHTETTERNKNP